MDRGSKKKPARKKRKAADKSKASAADDFDMISDEDVAVDRKKERSIGIKKSTKKRKEKVSGKKSEVDLFRSVSKKGKQTTNEAQVAAGGYYSAGQVAINDMMRRALEEEQYSALGSIIETDSSDDEAVVIGRSPRPSLDRGAIQAAFKKNLIRERAADESVGSIVLVKSQRSDEATSSVSTSTATSKSKSQQTSPKGDDSKHDDMDAQDADEEEASEEQDDEEDSSVFGQTSTGGGSNNNATWVECDKCKKWRRLRGTVDAKKLPPKWFCSMNKNDPERAKCSAPEEEYSESNTPESATDHRIRKHLRLWVRRLKKSDSYEQNLPTMTRGKKKSVVTSSKEPYEWVRCCNPSCGKFRAILRFMDASNVIEASKNGEWFCVLNTWDEKMASCAAPQENLPASGCPPWVMQDE
eukprot:CAMPEP_0196824626 /NCGR_PEP_ID=MMETSP1362-20130617/92590_1 /TAXON_ID=163516 /ORGANISM="Leptocylindrus danicus, Strain CCMP1856" /LENGTH=411 /DNA_ID=CAMNT_0042204945 /DNA_START=53 /DNA_END=1288 /DNA_ORIENTATION=-